MTEIFCPGDSALDDHRVLAWREARAIGDAVSADLSPQLRAEIGRPPETA